MLTLLIGRAGAGKSDTLIAHICAARGRRQILIVPEQYSHEAERRLCQAGGNGISQTAEVLSFTRLASRVFSVTGGLAAPTLDGGGRILLMYSAVKAVSAHLTVYQRFSRKPSFLSGLLTTLDECKSYCVTPAALADAGTSAGGLEGEKLSDLGLIFGAYDALCAQTAADPRDRLSRLAQALQESRWGLGMDFYVDGFTDFTPQERLVLSALLTQAHAVTVALTCDGLDGGNQDVFSPARRTAVQLLRLAEVGRVPTEVVHPAPRRTEGKDEALLHLERQLPADDLLPWTAPCPALSFFEATCPWSEAEWAAATVLDLVRTGDYRYRDIAVAARRFDGYCEVVETVFSRYGIPVFLSKTSDILEKPILTLLTAALDTVAGNYSYDDLFRYLKTGLTDLSPEDCDLLENYALKWNLRGSQWTVKADWTRSPRGYGGELSPADTALLARLNSLRRRVTAPLERLRKNGTKTGRGQAMALYRLLEEIQLPQRLAQRTEGLRARGKLNLAEEYSQLWRILTGGLEQCALLLGDTPMELEEFSGLFSLVLSQYDVGTIPVSLDRVTAGDCGRMGYRDVKVLLLLGCDDDSMPLATPNPGLFTDDDRVLLTELGLELAPCLDHKLQREMTISYVAAATPTRRLFLSFSATDGGGSPHRPAFLVSRLRLLFPQAVYQREREGDGSFRLAAPGPALELAGTRPDVRAALSALPQYAEKVARMERGLAQERGHLSRPMVETLYGQRVPMSASRMDLYKSCHFSYFMRYGLKADTRQPAGFEAPEYGTFIHFVLEHVFQHPDCKSAQEAFSAGQAANLHAIIRGVVTQYVQEELGGLEDKTPRFQYLFRRLLKSVNAVVENVAEELTHSAFVPMAFELGFAKGGAMPPVEFTGDGLTVSVSGFVDRVDGWVKDQKLYLRIVDYKTGRKSFDLTDIWNGIGLQMLLYLFTLEQEGGKLFGYEITPAGVLYLPARDAVIAGSRSMTDAERRKKVDSELRRKGLLLNDPDVLEAMERPGEEGIRFLPVRLSAKTGAITGDALVDAEKLGKLSRHTKETLAEIARELALGNISADPYWRGADHNACQFCEYAAACQFEEGHGGDCRRWLPTVGNEAFWESLK